MENRERKEIYTGKTNVDITVNIYNVDGVKTAIYKKAYSNKSDTLYYIETL